MIEDEMVGWHHRLNGHEFEWILGVGDGQGGLACCSPWSFRESDMTGWMNTTSSSNGVSVANVVVLTCYRTVPLGDKLRVLLYLFIYF